MLYYVLVLTLGKKPKKSVLIGDSDDDGESNSYDYNDSFIDDVEEEGEGMQECFHM